jgi:hypothetical protein
MYVYPPTNGERLRHFYNNCTKNTVLQQLETKLWKNADALFRLSSMKASNTRNSSVPDHQYFLNFQKL